MKSNSKKEEPTFNFECVLKNRGKFYISQKSLDDIRYGYIYGKLCFGSRQSEFSQFLKSNNLVLVKISDDMSVIKHPTSDFKPI